MPINTGGQQSGITGQPSKLAVEAGEVVDIILDESHPEYTDTGNGVGCCLVRLIQTQRNQSDYSLNWLKPASANNIQYPLIGELVMCMDGASADSQRQSGATMKYWLPYPQNVFNDVNENSLPFASYALDRRLGTPSEFDRHKGDAEPEGPTLGNSFESKEIQTLQPYEGDMILQGRWGNSIRFGSTADPQAGDPNLYSDGGAKGDPIITMNVGYGDASDTAEGYHIEDWSTSGDGTQVVLAAGQIIPLEIASTNKDSYHNSSNPDEQDAYEGNQIILNSDRIVFNAKTDSILGTAKVSVGFSTEGTFNVDADDHTIIDSPKIYLGNASTDEAEPVALGQTLVDWLQELCDALSAETHPTACGPSGTPINAADYSSLKSKAPDILSQNSFCTKTN
jgi:hypothetical protein|tara:strand:+ start:225 stop:1409 length:1185 start_codon:yes stop_codon:yes gene_type:complete